MAVVFVVRSRCCRGVAGESLQMASAAVEGIRAQNAGMKPGGHTSLCGLASGCVVARCWDAPGLVMKLWSALGRLGVTAVLTVFQPDTCMPAAACCPQVPRQLPKGEGCVCQVWARIEALVRNVQLRAAFTSTRIMLNQSFKQLE
jgi:hypothetical protein